MGEERMRCPECGNENINEMLVEFIWIDPERGEMHDITTLPKFLHYLRYPDDRRGERMEPKEAVVRNILQVWCAAHIPFNAPGRPEIHKTKERIEIKPTRWGI